MSATAEYYTDGFLRYDAFPQNSFAQRDLTVPRFARAVEVRGGNTKPVKAIAWSCDGKRVATGTEEKGLRIWDAQHIGAHAIKVDIASSFSLPSSSRTPSPHSSNVAALAWSPVDPNALVSGCKGVGSGGCAVAVWDVTNGAAPVATFKLPGDVLHVAFHPQGRHFAVVCPRATRDEVLFFWLQERDGNEVWEQRTDIIMGGAGIDTGAEEINSLRFWLAGDSVMSVSNDGSLMTWWYPLDERPPLVRPADISPESEPPAKKSRTASPEPETEAEAEREATDEGREAVEGEEAEGAPAPGTGAGTPANEDGNADDAETPAGEIPEVKVDAPDGDINMAEPSPEAAAGSAVPSAAPSPGATAAPSAPASAAPSAPATAAPTRQPTPQASTPAEIDAAANAAKEIAARAAAALELERRKHRQLAQCFRLVPHVASLLALAVDPLGRYLAIGGQDGRVSLLSTQDWIVERNFDAPTTAIRHAAFSPDGELLAVGDDTAVFVFAVYTRATVARIPVTNSVNSLAWCPVRNALTYSTSSKIGVVWYVVNQE